MKASPELVQELMESKQKESGNDLVRTFARFLQRNWCVLLVQ